MRFSLHRGQTLHIRCRLSLRVEMVAARPRVPPRRSTKAQSEAMSDWSTAPFSADSQANACQADCCRPVWRRPTLRPLSGPP
jgi:hypothetical protein